MAKAAARKKNLTKTNLLASIATATDIPKKQVAALLVGLAAQIKQSLSTNGATTILGLVKIEKKTVPACPTWPAYIEVTVLPELLPGPDRYCARGLHTYHQSPATNKYGQPICGSCGADEIDWDRLHERDIADVEYTVAQLQTDRFRYKWWAKDLDEAAVKHALRKGPTGIKDAIRKRVHDSVGQLYRMEDGKVEPFRDGAQTPFRGNIIYYGQHATATCCRKCIEVWHGIPRGRKLTQEEITYLVDLLLVYVRFKLPELGIDCRSK